jgi:hypothetical protein
MPEQESIHCSNTAAHLIVFPVAMGSITWPGETILRPA